MKNRDLHEQGGGKEPSRQHQQNNEDKNGLPLMSTSDLGWRPRSRAPLSMKEATSDYKEKTCDRYKEKTCDEMTETKAEKCMGGS
jgi:hypothetical protein